jgi:DNA helicase-2/ATP-dependent DNA helicase PcrA
MNKSVAEHGMQIANEESANRRYQAILERKANAGQPVAVSRSQLWTGSGVTAPKSGVAGPLVGRIALDEPDDLVGGSDFYIGPWHNVEDGIIVFSWAAPVSEAFYDLDARNRSVGGVTCRRTLIVQSAAVEDFVDDWLVEPAEHSPFAALRPLSIPKPPLTIESQPSTSLKLEVPTPVSPAGAPSPDIEKQMADPTPPPPAHVAPKVTGRLRPLRAEDAVRAALTAPRRASLPNLLGTLQPDQYDFVTRPVQPPLVVQGHPGTGKTVIAAHRAAWLVHPERGPSDSAIRVLIVGPNDQYAGHIKGVLDTLIADRRQVVAMGVTKILERLRRMKYEVSGPPDGDHYDVDNELAYIIEAAAMELRAVGELSLNTKVESGAKLVYEAIRTNQAAGTPLTEDRDLIAYLRKLPRWGVTVTQRRYLPLVTQCSVSAVPYNAKGFQHIIVDEAQDIRPLEWRLIAMLNRTNSWTILGDMNQRRTDWCYHTWDQLGVDLDIADDMGKLAPSVFARGYRSTGPIMKYANHLLPAKERAVELVQTDGPPPRVYKVKSADLAHSVETLITHLLDVHEPGSVAVIATPINKKEIQTQLVAQGWRQDPVNSMVMTLQERRLNLHSPESARGLEFDGVVVVEPTDFPKNLGRFGPLYTSLTRANRELAVVYSDSLPDGIRNQGMPSRISDLG